MKKLLLSMILLWGSFTAFSQAGLEIQLVNEQQKAVPFHPVAIDNAATGFHLEKMSDAQGKVKVSGLSTSGTYQVTAGESDDYKPLISGEISLRSNQLQSVTLVLQSKGDENLSEVVVKGGSSIAKINTVNAEVSSELTTKEIETLPIEGRDITRALYRLPNVTQATGFFPEAPNVSINGANALYTNYMIDGMDNNENFLGGMKFNIPVGFTKNITVLTNNYSAEYGWTGNGVFDITSKSGGNQVKGEAFYITRPGPVIDSPSPYAQRDLSGNQVKDGFQRHQFGFGVGGPLVKDKTFYYLNAEQTFDIKDNLLNSPGLGINQTVRGNNRFTYLSGKIDQFWSDRFHSSLRVNGGLVNIQFQGGGLEGGVSFPSAGYSQDRNSLLIANSNIYSSENFTSETNLQFSRFRWNYSHAVNPNDPNVTILDPSETVVGVVGNPGFVFDDTENTLQLQQKFVWYKNKHTFKAGFGVISSDFNLLGGGNPNGSYTVKLTQAQLNALKGRADLKPQDIPASAEVLGYSVELRPQSFGKRQNRYSAYVEDLYSVNSKLNLTLGLRYDYDNLSKGGDSKGDLNNIAPRFNFNYKLNEKSAIRGGYGIFYDKIVYSIYSDALQQSTTSPGYLKQLQELKAQGILPNSMELNAVTFPGNVTAAFDRTGVQTAGITYLNGPSAASLQSYRDGVFNGGDARILNPNGYQNPYTHQFNLGYQYQLNDHVLFYVDAIHTHSYNLFRLSNLNAAAPYPIIYSPSFTTADVRSPAAADATGPIPIGSDGQGSYALVNGDTLRSGARNIIMTESKGESKYWALNINLVKDRGEDKFAYRLSYTLSQLRNNTEDINFRAMDSNNFEKEWGPSINDRTHVINAIGYYYPYKALSVSLASLMQSGQPINRIPEGFGTTDLNGDGSSFGDAYVGNSDRYPGESRNNDRLPWSVTFDLGLQYNLYLRDQSHFEITADVFNLFNTTNLSGYSNNATQSNQIQPGAKASGVLIRRNAAPPRQFQFGVKYSF